MVLGSLIHDHLGFSVLLLNSSVARDLMEPDQFTLVKVAFVPGPIALDSRSPGPLLKV
jgi:hypothetical protein